jgi:hypothetical protein
MSLSKSPAGAKSLPYLLSAALLLLFVFAGAQADLPNAELAKIFPAELSGFHQVRAPLQAIRSNKESLVVTGDYPKWSLPTFIADSEYLSPDGEKFRVEVVKFENDSAAYSWYTERLKHWRESGATGISPVEGVGTASAMSSSLSLACFKGTAFVTVASENGKNPDRLKTLARVFAETLDPGEGEIPVLVKHLPDPAIAQRNAVYAVSPGPLLGSIPNQPILKEVNFDGGTEAVLANYGQAQLVIVEFTTPQFSIENDQRIWTRISELKSQGQPTPIAYRRVGNYSVFVFNADEKTANALVDQVSYEQVVQWLGDDPHMADRLTRYFRRTTSGVLIAVLKSSGLSLILCAGIGTLFGAMLFRHRRARQAAFYSDAGGSTRLNLDELTHANKSQRLLGPGEQSEADS